MNLKMLTFSIIVILFTTTSHAQEDVMIQILRSNIGITEGIGSNGFACGISIKKIRKGKLQVSYGDAFGQYEAQYPVRSSKGKWILNADRNEISYFLPYDKSITFKFDEKNYFFHSYKVVSGGNLENNCVLFRK